MSEEPRLWPAMLVAGLLVISMGAVFVIGGENEMDGPTLPEGQDIWLTYSATGVYNGTDIEGTYECFIHKWENSGWSVGIGYNMTGNMEEMYPDLPKVLAQGSYVDDSELDTQWGTKQVQRCIYAELDHERPGLFISYTGSHTDLEYHVIFLSPDSHVTFDLIEIGIEGMDDYDLTPASDSDLLAENRYANDYSGTSGPYSYMLIEPRDDEYCRIYINSTNSAIVVMDENDIYNMIDGREYQYRYGWTVIGNGSTDFIINEGLAFFMCYPLTYVLEGTHVQADVDVFER